MRRALASAVLTVAAMVAPLTVSASAQEQIDCESIVVDYSGEGVLGDTDAVEQSLNPLFSVGADVRVRVFDTVPHGSLNQYLADAIDQCASWGDYWGQKPNLIVIMFTMHDDYTLVEYGEHYLSSLNPDIDRIRVDVLDNAIIAGDSAGGIAAAAKEMATAIDQYVPDSGSGGGTTVIHEAPSKAGTIFAWLSVGLAGLIVLAGFVWLIAKANTRRKERRRELENIQRDIENQKRSISESVLALSGTNKENVMFTLQLLSGQLGEEDQSSLQQLREQLDAAEVVALEAQREAEIQDTSDNQGTIVGALHLLGVWSDVANKFTQEVTLLEQLQRRCDELMNQVNSASSEHSRLVSFSSEVGTLLVTVGEQGYQLGSRQGEYESAQQLLHQAGAKISAKRPGHALGELRRADAALQELKSGLEALLTVRSELSDRHERLQARQHGLLADAATAATSLEQIRDEYDESCWSDLAQADPARTVVSIQSNLDQARVHMQMENQQWDLAGRSLDQAEALLDEVTRLVRVVSQRQHHLDGLPAQLATAAHELSGRIEDLQARAKGSKGNQNEPEEQLRACAKSLQVIVKQLARPKPKLSGIEKTLENMGQKLNQIAGDISEIHQRKVRQDRLDANRGGTSFGTSYSSPTRRTGGGGGGGIPRRTGGSSGPRIGGGPRRTGGSSGKRGG